MNAAAPGLTAALCESSSGRWCAQPLKINASAAPTLGASVRHAARDLVNVSVILDLSIALDLRFTEKQIAMAKVFAASTPPEDLDPRIDALVNDPIGRVADKWTMLILEVLAEKGELRFTRLSELVEGISQKMLTQTCGRWSATVWLQELSIPSCHRRSNTN